MMMYHLNNLQKLQWKTKQIAKKLIKVGYSQKGFYPAINAI